MSTFTRLHLQLLHTHSPPTELFSCMLISLQDCVDVYNLGFIECTYFFIPIKLSHSRHFVKNIHFRPLREGLFMLIYLPTSSRIHCISCLHCGLCFRDENGKFEAIFFASVLRATGWVSGGTSWGAHRCY